MNVAILIEKFGAAGGAERMAGYVVRGLRDSGHEVHVYAAAFEGDLDGLCVPHRVSARRVLANRHVAFARNAASALGTHDVVYSFTRTIRHDVLRLGGGIHAEYLRRMEPARSLAGRAFSRVNPKERSILALEREGLAAAKRIVAVSERVRREAREHYGLSDEKLVVLRNGVDLNRFHPRAKAGRDAWLRALGAKPDRLTALFAGSGWKRKGLAAAIEALPRAAGVQLIVCGRDRDLGRFADLAGRLEVADRVYFARTRSDIEQAYGAADVLVLPALYDPYPNVCLEALATGVPVIVSPVCGPAEIVEPGVDSFVEDEPVRIAEALARLQDPSCRRRMGDAARAKAERHPIGAYVSATLELLQRS